ncbi:MAG TPA: tRNA 2-thiouridine(34) synthase MnmA, partial [Candidatus Gracilibacteria bacterium]|nr:tRNA 2-thiouridine(34) synthase MnmA [Candidatus Gracilibacteria bacterium]
MSQKSQESGKKVLVGMSGGVDSSVTACLLKEMGYEVIGIHLRFWTDPTVFSDEEQIKFPQNKCCTLEGLAKTRRVAQKIGIPFYVLNFEESFKTEVVDYFIEGYRNGITPNPCIECNRSVKFGLFLEKMRELGADYVATGHYARKVTVTEPDSSERYELWTAKDAQKDQSYFLYTLTQEKLRHILFPIGEYSKTEVRKLAEKFGIGEINEQKESQNLCFFPEATHGPFLKRHLAGDSFEHGPIITTEGQTIGEHMGLPNYTIGQRKGLGIGGMKGEGEGLPWYVVSIDRSRNALIVGKDKDLQKQVLEAHTLSFVAEKLPEGRKEIRAKIRSRFPMQPATLSVETDASEPK